jgi:hypothetical protein
MSSYYTYEGNLRDRNKFTSTVNTTFGTKRYFSQLDTEVYFGAEQIDEMVAIDFTISEPKLPIYGFNSFYANRIVSGRRTIQGTFAINFTSTTYLLNIFNKIDDSILKAKYNPTGSDLLLDYESLLYRCEGEDTTGLGIGNNAIFSKIFDITLSYGYGKTEGKQTYNCCWQTLVGVQIVDYRQALDTEGNPILDMYSFIAKDIRYIDAGSESSNTGSTPETDTEVVDPEIVLEPGAEEKIPIANESVDNQDRKDVYNITQNSNKPGYLVDPKFCYTPPGSVAASAYPYIRLTIKGINDNNTEFTNVRMIISDHLNGINTTLEFKNVKNNGSSIYELKDSTRDLGVDLRKFFTQDPEGYSPECHVSFSTKLNDKETKLDYTTRMTLGSTGPVSFK